MIEEYFQEMAEDFIKCIESFERNLTTIRTGRASPVLLENVQVDVSSYNAKMPLKQLASITAPDARMLVVNPWDKSTMTDIERGIMSAGLGLNPNNDGNIIRVPIPPLTGERRQELTRKVRHMAEDAKVRARQVRKDYNDLVKEAENDKEISEDDSRGYMQEVQDATNECVIKLEELCKVKEKELMEV
jgi:ribosome recycling factor